VLASALLINALSEALFVGTTLKLAAAPPALRLRGGAFAHARQHHTMKVAANDDADSIEQAASKATRIGSVRNVESLRFVLLHYCTVC
jgi:hypothetical protein